MNRYVGFDAERILYFCTVDAATADAIRASGVFLELPAGIAEGNLTLDDLRIAYPQHFAD